MRLRTVFALAVLSMVICAAGSAEKPKFNLTVHVDSSDYTSTCTGRGCYGLQRLNVTIDGKKYILASEEIFMVTGVLQGDYELVGVLRNDDYAARIVKNESKYPAVYHRVIEIQIADGVTRRYTVIGEAAN